MRRIGSNIRKQNADVKSNRVVRNIIRYTEEEEPRNEYPKRIVSPPAASTCCTDENRTMVGNVREIDGFKFCYKICDTCGHAVKYYFPAVEGHERRRSSPTASGRSTWCSSSGALRAARSEPKVSELPGAEDPPTALLTAPKDGRRCPIGPRPGSRV